MSWIMAAIAAVSAGLQIGGKLGGNEDAQTAGGLLGTLGTAGGAMGGFGGGSPIMPPGMATAGGMASGVGTAGAVSPISTITDQIGSSFKTVAPFAPMLQKMMGSGGSALPVAPPLGGGGMDIRGRKPTFANIPKQLVIRTQPSQVVSRKPEQIEAILAMLRRGGMV